MEILDIKDDCKRKYKEEESEVELKFHKSELKTEIKSEPIVNAESDMMHFKVEYPKIVIDDSNHNQFICENELHSEIKKFIKTEEVTESLESGDRIGFKREEEDKDTTLVDMDLEYFEVAPRILQNDQQTFQREEYETGPYDRQQRLDEYCFMCQEFGHVMTSECIICFNCGVKGHSRRDCPYDTQVFNQATRDTKYEYENLLPQSFQSKEWIHNNVVDDYNGNVPAKSSLQIEDNAKKIKYIKLNAKAKKVHNEELSDDMADACKTSCQICHKVFTLCSMRVHTIKDHNLQITRYKDESDDKINWSNLIEPDDLKTLINKMAAVDLSGEFSQEQVEAVRLLPAVDEASLDRIVTSEVQMCGLCRRIFVSIEGFDNHIEEEHGHGEDD